MCTDSPSRSSRLVNATPFFYGWVILLVGTIGAVMMGPSQTFTVSLFIDFFVQELHISRANVSLLYGVATLGASFLLPITGWLVDRYGTRGIMLLVSLGLGLACLGMANVQGIFTLLIGLLALRFFGFGSMQLVSNNIIAQWFIRRRGMVMGLFGQSLAVGLIVFPALGEYLINRFEWRGAWIMLGLLVLGVMLPVSWFFYRDNPEKYGLLPDGDPAPPPDLSATGGSSLVNEENWTLAEARRTGAFWIFALAFTVLSTVMAGVVFHQPALFEERGLSREISVHSFQVMALFSIVGNLAMGRLLDMLSARLLLILVVSILAGMLILVQVMVTPLQAMVYAALLGLVSGSNRVMNATVWAKYFGRRYLGSIRGVTMIGMLGGTALGPYPLGLSADVLGSYSPALTGLLALPLIIGVLTPFVKRPQKARDASSGEEKE